MSGLQAALSVQPAELSQQAIAVTAWFAMRQGSTNFAFRAVAWTALCRRTVGGESPELAKALLETGQYTPRSAQDMWSLGLALLDTMGGQRPFGHYMVLSDSRFQTETAASGRSTTHLEYVAGLLSDPVPYADQVRLFWSGSVQ